MKKHLPGWAVLLIITLAAGLALGATYALTKDPIEEQARITAENARKAALPEASRFVLFSEAEKPGSANVVDWIYAGLGQPKTMPLTLEDIDVISGATLTSRAVVDGLNAAYAAYQADERTAEEKNGVAFSGEGVGFKGDPVYVEATFDDSVITSVSIGDDRFDETPNLGGQALEYAFQRQFTDPVGYVAQKTVKGFGGEVEVIAGVSIAKESMAMPLTIDDIDAVAGATLTSQAVVDGLNAAYAAYQADERTAEKKNFVAFSGEGKGFQGDPVYVEAAFSGNHIASISIGDDRFKETPALGGRVLEDAFQEQFTQLKDRLVLGGISVGGSNFSETAGLGAKSKDAAFTDQFRDKPVSDGLKLIKAGEEKAENTIDAITSATVTSTAVVNGVNVIIDEIKSSALGIADVSMPEKPEGAQVYSASAQGYRGPVYVEAAFDADGQVSYISVGDDAFAEDIGADAVKPKFMIQFIGKQAPVALADVDALAGATITTNAVISALNDAYAQAAGGEPAAPPVTEPAPSAAPEATAEPANVQPTGDTYTAEAQGCIGPVAVTVGFDGDKIASLTVGDDRFAETAGLGALAQEESFTQQFIGKTVPLALSDIDAIANATITSQAVVDAINAAYAQAAEPGKALPAEEPTPTPAPEITPAPTSEPVAEPTPAPVKTTPAPSAEGAYTGESILFFDRITVLAQFDGDTLQSVNVSRTDVGTGEAVALPDSEALVTPLVGEKLPMDPAAYALPGVDEATAQAVIIAINDAYASYQAGEAPVLIDGTKGGDVLPEQSGHTYRGSAVAFFQNIEAVAGIENDTLVSLQVFEKAVDAEAWAASPRQAEMDDLFVGKALPLDTKQQDAYTAAVAVAVNEAYKAQLSAGYDGIMTLAQQLAAFDEEDWVIGSSWYGESIIFFDRVQVGVLMVEGEPHSFYALVTPIGPYTDDQVIRLHDELNPLLGQPLPLDPQDITLEGVSAYQAQAIAIAINQAYENYLAGQQ